MKPRFKVGDIVRIRPEYRDDDIREVIYVDETDDENPYQLDGDDDFRLKWWSDEMLEKYEPKFELTAEEVEIVRLAMIGHCSDIDNIITLHFLTGVEPKNKGEIKRLYNIGHNLLTRIIEWQDEQASK